MARHEIRRRGLDGELYRPTVIPIWKMLIYPQPGAPPLLFIGGVLRIDMNEIDTILGRPPELDELPDTLVIRFRDLSEYHIYFRSKQDEYITRLTIFGQEIN